MACGICNYSWPFCDCTREMKDAYYAGKEDGKNSILSELETLKAEHKILVQALKDAEELQYLTNARAVKAENKLTMIKTDTIYSAVYICKQIAKEAVGYNLPQMAMGAQKCATDILALKNESNE